MKPEDVDCPADAGSTAADTDEPKPLLLPDDPWQSVRCAANRPPSTRPIRTPLSGWQVGIVCGVLIGLWMLPPVRNTLFSQLQFALASDAAPWLEPLQRTHRDVQRLDAVSVSAPDDYLLQVGRATALVDVGGLRATDVAHPADNDHTLFRLGELTRQFPE